MASRVGERFPVLALDLAGFGECPPPPDGDYCLEAQARHVIGAAAEAGFSRWVLVGNSLGGSVALAAAQLAPGQTSALVLVNAAAWPDGLRPLGRLAAVTGRLRIARPVLQTVPTWALALGLRLGSGSAAHAARCRNILGQASGSRAFLATVNELAGDGLSRLSLDYGAVTCPALVLHGDRDPLLSIRSSERLAAALPAGRLQILRGLGHFPQEQDPDLLARLCLEMVES